MIDYHSGGHQKTKPFALITTWLTILIAAMPVAAQVDAEIAPDNVPDPNNAPQTAPPPTRPLVARGPQVQQREQKLRELMTKFGVAETAIQDAVIIYIEEDARAQRPLRLQGRKLLNALQNKAVDGKAVTDEQMRALLEAFQMALDANLERTVEAESALDKKIGYTRNPRLQAMLILLGIIGNAPPAVALAIPGQPHGPGQYRPGQWGSNGRSNLTAKQRREQREAAQRAALLKQFDKDGDGLLDVAERAEADAVMKGQQNPPDETPDGAAENGGAENGGAENGSEAPPQPGPALNPAEEPEPVAPAQPDTPIEGDPVAGEGDAGEVPPQAPPEGE